MAFINEWFWFFLLLPIGGVFTGYFRTQTFFAVAQTAAYISVSSVSAGSQPVERQRVYSARVGDGRAHACPSRVRRF